MFGVPMPDTDGQEIINLLNDLVAKAKKAGADATASAASAPAFFALATRSLSRLMISCPSVSGIGTPNIYSQRGDEAVRKSFDAKAAEDRAEDAEVSSIARGAGIPSATKHREYMGAARPQIFLRVLCVSSAPSASKRCFSPPRCLGGEHHHFQIGLPLPGRP